MFIINGAEDDRLGKLEDCEIYAAQFDIRNWDNTKKELVANIKDQVS